MSANHVTIEVTGGTYRTDYRYGKENNCRCCGRPINYRKAVAVKVVESTAGYRYDGARDAYVTSPGEVTFAPIAEHLGTEPAEWASAIGSQCAKQLSKEYRTPMKRATRLFVESGNF